MVRLLILVASMLMPVAALADYACLTKEWAGVFTDEGAVGSQSGVDPQPDTFFVRKVDGGWRVTWHEENTVIFDWCNESVTFCESEDSYAGMFMRDAKHNTFVVNMMRFGGSDGGNDRRWHISVVGKCSEM